MINKRPWEKKLRIFLFLVSLVIVILGYRLYNLQILQSKAFETQSQQNRIREIPLNARRGNIFDTKGKVLATSKPVFEVAIDTADLENKEVVAAKLANILADVEITKETILADIKKQRRKYEPVVIKRLPYQEGISVVTKIKENHLELPGVMINEQPMRVYPNNALAGHILGTIGKINENELSELSGENYSINDWIGKSGLEEYFEHWSKDGSEYGLRGKKGAEKVEVNVRHRPVRTLNTVPPIPGNSLVLTLDAELQKTMEDAMRDTIALTAKTNPKSKAGAAVLIDVKTGAILAMTSAPNLNPNDFSMGKYKETREYYEDKDLRPTVNRAVQAKYPPGSTFKMVTGMAALHAKKITPNTVVFDNGRFWLPPYIKCWKTHGAVDYTRAIAVSCNTFFQNAGNLAGVNGIVNMAEQFGLGKKTGVELPEEIKGLLPTPEWKQSYYKSYFNNIYDWRRENLEKKYNALLVKAKTDIEKAKILEQKANESKKLEANYRIDINWYPKWQPFDTFNMSIGQGTNEYTIIQLANYVATVANGGNHMEPYLVKKIISPKGETVQEFDPKLLNKVNLSQEDLQATKKGMRAVMEPGGTAYFLFKDFPQEVKVAGKTGTAQTGLAKDDKNSDYHGLFVAFAPYENPKVAYAGIIEYGYHGGSSAGLIAKAVFEKYFNLKPAPIPQLPINSVE